MSTQPAPERPPPEPTPKPARPPADPPPPGPDATAPRPAEEGAIFRAFLDAGAEARVAYTAEKRIYTMVSEVVAPQLQPFLVEMRRLSAAHERRFEAQDRRFEEQDRRFEAQDRRFDELDRRLDNLTAAVTAQGEKLAEHDRKLEVIVARLDAMKVLGQVILGALALLITALIAVFGFLFTN